MAKKSLEDLLEEVKQELEDTIAVLNSLKTEVPEEIRQEINSIREVQIERLKKLNEYVNQAKKTLEYLSETAEAIEERLTDTDLRLNNLYNETLQKVEDLLNQIHKEVSKVLGTIEETAKNGAYQGVKEGLGKHLKEIKTSLEELKLTARHINKNLVKNQKDIEEIFERYQWSWFPAFLFVSAILFAGILYIGAIKENQETAAQILIGSLEIFFFLIGTYTVWKLSNRFPQKWVAYLISIFLLVVALFVGYTTYKGKIVITKKEVCDLPKPNNVEHYKDGRTCYFYDGWYKAYGKWHKGEIAICK